MAWHRAGGHRYEAASALPTQSAPRPAAAATATATTAALSMTGAIVEDNLDVKPVPLFEGGVEDQDVNLEGHDLSLSGPA